MRDMKYVEARCIGKNCQDEYLKKLVSAEEAVKVVKSGDRVITSFGGVALLGEALAARKDKLSNVTIHSYTPTEQNLGMFFEEGMDDVFYNTIEIFGGWVRTAPTGTDSKRTQFWPGTFSSMMKPFDERPDECPYTIDVAFASVSPPDKDGFCSFGSMLWNKRSYCKRAKKVIAVVKEDLIRTGGANFIHISEIDYIVEGPPVEVEEMTPQERADIIKALLSEAEPGVRELLEPIIPEIEDEAMQMRVAENISVLPLEEAQTRVTRLATMLGLVTEPDAVAAAITKYVSQMVNDGDTFQIGVGFISGQLISLGAFDDKHDLGIYSEMAARGFGDLVERGIVTGKYKTFHPGKVTVSSFTGCNAEDLEIIDGNPVFEQYDSEYLLDIRNVSQNDNLVAINNAVAVDLTGQINSETGIGPRLINGHGGQPEMHIGAILSKGGRALTLLPSTALGGTVSRIVPQLDQGALVTIPRYYADYIITEYGIASLMGKDCRQRAEALIAVAHPDFRAELRNAARGLFYP